MNSTLWTLVLDSFKRIVQIFLGKAKTEGALIGDVAVIKPTKQCLESLRVSSVFSILLLLLRDSSNFKIRIQAAAALAVPETIKDYGKSYYDVVKSVVHVVESFKSDQISEPSNFKYWIALEKQLTSTMLQLLGLASRCDQRAMQDLLVKKASFLEVWIEGLCSSLGDTSNSLDEAKHVSVDQKKDVIFRTIRSLIEVYKSSNHDVIAQRFDKLGSSLL